ncbi:MAG TPA: aminotransferase class I/II-fold pyridoxal phosphate-dependent enzyme [Mycobacteriales bacterium]|nr:aminotransferase class I/II-fold pyridoxal phosphate-dependent enzyme [Mycobacteriales bacterium]
MADDDDFDGVSLADLRKRRSSRWVTHPPDVLPAFVAELDVPLADPVRRALHDAVDAGDLGYTEPDRLPEAFAGFVADRHGWSVDPADVHLVPDVMVGIIEVLRAAGGAGEAVVINPPVYPPFFDGLPEAGRRIVEVPLARDGTGYGLDLDGLEAAFRAGARTYLLCSPHNPVGRVWTEPDLRRVAELADRYGVLVLSDEIHAPLTLPGARHTPFPTVAGDRSVAFWSASKAWNTAGLKCAVAVTSGPRGRELLGRLPAEVRYRAGILGVAASVAAFTEGRRWLDALLAHLDRNRQLLADLLARALPETGYRPPQASFLAWLDLRAYDLGDDPAVPLRQQGRVALERGLAFGPQGAGFARLTIGTSRALLTEAVDRIAAATRT